jgi:polar amino acid transport system substrate-binding protein
MGNGAFHPDRITIHGSWEMFMHKHVLCIGFLLVVAGGLISASAFAVAQTRNISIVGDEEKRGSYLVEITQEAFRRVGYEPEFDFVPWARALFQCEHGKQTVLLAAYYTNERAEKMAFTEPIGATRVFLLKRKDQQITFKTMNDLRPYRIGHIIGSKVNPDFDTAEATFLKMEYVSTAEQNMSKLLAGRIDLMVEKEERIKQLLDTTFAKDKDRLELIYPPLQLNHFYNCISKAQPDCQQMIADFNRGLQMIQKDGTLTAILKRHGILPVPSRKP